MKLKYQGDVSCIAFLFFIVYNYWTSGIT